MTATNDTNYSIWTNFANLAFGLFLNIHQFVSPETGDQSDMRHIHNEHTHKT